MRTTLDIEDDDGETVIVLLAGGDKSTQDKDIRNAKALAKDLKEL